MRKHSKFITVLLSALLAVCLVQTVFVQAFATEMGDDDFGWGNASTSDEAETVYPVSMKVVKAPESVTVNNYGDQITDSTFWSNVVLHIVYSNGEEYDVNCDGIDSEDGIVPPIAEIDGYKGKIYYGTNSKNEDTISFYIAYAYAEDDGVTCTVSADFSAEKVADPHSIVRYELTKLPNRVFTEPLYTCSFNDIMANDRELALKLDAKKSISNNIDGMEVTFYYANGEKGGTVTFDSSMMYGCVPWYAMYSAKNVDEYGNFVNIGVTDEGNYKFTVYFRAGDAISGINGITYTAKSVDNPNPAVKPTSTEDTPAKPSDNTSSATSDVATKDNANNNNSTNGTANNGVVATGDFATPAIITVVMLSAVAVMFVFKRKRMF